jgi:Kef-type K+ transport system membrane component KefB
MSGIVLLAAGGGGPGLAGQIGLVLLAAAILSLVFEKLRLPVAPALLLAGFAVGPSGLAWITDEDSVATIANLGLTFLLFIIGLELDVRSLAKSARTLASAALLQVPITTGLAFGGFLGLQHLGVLPPGTYTSLYFAFACAFSSTLLVAKQLSARYQMDTTDGRLALGLLIFQDIWAIVLLAVQPSFANPDVWVIAQTLAGIVIIAFIAAVVARRVLPLAFKVVAKQPELLVLLALGWCFGLGVLGSNLTTIAKAMNLPIETTVSMEMGALIAGASIASFPYAHEVVGKVSNLRDFFVTLFFAAIGMSIPWPDSWTPIIAAMIVGGVLLVTRPFVFVPLFMAGGVSPRNAWTTSMKMAQLSEFALVVLHLGVGFQHIDAGVQSTVSFAFVGLAFLTSFAFDYADTSYALVSKIVPWLRMKDGAKDDDGHGHGPPARVVLLGFHRLASSLLHEISTTQPELLPQTLVIDFNVALHEKIAKTGARVVYGDLSNTDTLAHAPVAEGALVISTVGDDLLRGTNNRQLVAKLRELWPTCRIVAVAVRRADVDVIREAGADFVFMTHMEASLSLLPVVLAGANGHLSDVAIERRAMFGALAERAEVMD